MGTFFISLGNSDFVEKIEKSGSPNCLLMSQKRSFSNPLEVSEESTYAFVIVYPQPEFMI